MRKRAKIALIVLLLAAMGLIILEILRLPEPDPIVDGKPLRVWLDGLTVGRPGAERAMEKTGTNAIPTLLRMLRQRDSPLKRIAMQIAHKQHLIKINYIPAEARNEAAWWAFRQLRGNAKAAVPALIEIYEMRISECSQESAARSLGAIGSAAKPAIPALLRGTTNANTGVRRSALMALAEIHAEPEVVVPVLTKALSDPDAWVRGSASTGLLLFGGEAKLAFPALLKVLNDQDQEVRGRARSALMNIDPKAAAEAGVK